MKKITALLLTALLCLALAACGESPAAPEATQAPAATEAPAAQPTDAPAETAAPDETEANRELARSLIDRPVAELYQALGEPLSPPEYASSCLVKDGQDGTLLYEGFTVYTIVDAEGAETVYDVE